ncbi:MAG: terminase large subunit [Anaerorhabdus sp.]|uniref:terminase large subunit n=1 Tax=Anaerorhabdus sp. TaxID=1872524 RepID=UPI002FC9F8A3
MISNLQLIIGRIESNDLVVCNKIRTQFMKLKKDMNDPKYTFDIEKAQRPIRWIEKFCKHSKGKWMGKSVVLEPIQKAMIEAIFGFINSDGTRRFREVLIIMGRKNGKSLLLSCIALYMMCADNEGGSQVACVASKKDQAKLVFNEAKNMVTQSPALSSNIKKRKSDLYYPRTFSTFEPLASDSNTLDGLNLHLGIIDELHSIKDRNIYDTAKQSMTAREQPLMVMISTAGFNRESIYDSQYEYATNVLQGSVIDDTYLCFIFELDSRNEWLVEEMWIKANPLLGVSKKLSALIASVERAKSEKGYLKTVLTKDFNIPETSSEAWLSLDEINNKETYNIADHKDTYAVGGVDLSSVNDLTCASLLWRKDGLYFLNQMYFIPRDIAEQKEKEDKVPYGIWKDQGFIRYCDGAKVDDRDVTKWFVEMRDTYGIYPLWIGYDRWGANSYVNDMVNNGFTMESVIQGAMTMSNPMKIMAADLRAKLINYNNNPIFKWNLTNTQVQVDTNGNIRPVKGRNSKQRIDGTVSAIDAFVIMQKHLEDYSNLQK